MPTPVSLSDVLVALGGPLEERPLWAVLHQAASALREHLQGSLSLLITPETLLLQRGGTVQLMQGIPGDARFTAPELFADDASLGGQAAMEKSYVYSLGMTLFTAMENSLDDGQPSLVTGSLRSLLLGMIEESVDERVTLTQVLSSSKQHIEGSGQEEVDRLVDYILGPSHDLSSDYGDVDMDDANLESELNEAMKMRTLGSVEYLQSPSYGSRTGSCLSLASKGSHSSGGNLRRHSSFHSSGSRENLAHLGSLPTIYYASVGSQEKLNVRRTTTAGRMQPRDVSFSSERLNLHIQPQDIEALASKAKSTGRRLPPAPTTSSPVYQRRHRETDIRRSASFHCTTTGHAQPARFHRTSSDSHPEDGNSSLGLGKPKPSLSPLPSPSPSPPSSPSPFHNTEGMPPVDALEEDTPLQRAVETVDHPQVDGVSEREEEVTGSLEAGITQLQPPQLSVTWDDMPLLPPPPPPPLEEEEVEEEEEEEEVTEGEEDEDEGEGEKEEEEEEASGKAVQVVPSLQKIDSILRTHRRASSEPDPLEVHFDLGLSSASSFPSVASGDHPPNKTEEHTVPLAAEEVKQERNASPSRFSEAKHDNGTDPQTHSPASGFPVVMDTPLTPSQPPPSPPTRPPMFTPLKQPEQEKSGEEKGKEGEEEEEGEEERRGGREESLLNATFDYTEVEDMIPVAMENKHEEEFEFGSPPPVPPTSPPELLSTPPPSPPPIPSSSPPRLSLGEDSAAFIAAYISDTSLHPPPSHPPPPPPEEEEMEDDSPLYEKVTLSGRPKHAVLEALEREDIQPYASLLWDTLDSSHKVTDQQSVQPRPTPAPEEGEGEEKQREGEDPFAALYAKVQKRGSRKERRKSEEEEESWEREDAQGGDHHVSELYSEVVKPKWSFEEGDTSDSDAFQDVVRKTSSAGDICSIHLAEVHDPKRMSMPPESLPTLHLQDTPTSLPSSPPSSPLPKVPAFDITFEEDWKKLQQNEKSMEKLQHVFGPEFTHLSDVASKPAPHSPSPQEMPEGRRRVIVMMLNDKAVEFHVEHTSCCRELFQQVVSYLSLREPMFFGLAVMKDNDKMFVDLDRKLSKYAPPGWALTPTDTQATFSLLFRVKFFVEDISTLKFSQTRHQYYLELRRDIREGKIHCSEDGATRLASYALQAEKGDYDQTQSRHGYFSLEDYLPRRMIEHVNRANISEVLHNLHMEKAGLSSEQAEMEFLKEAQKQSEYGMVLYRVGQDKKTIGNMWVGFHVGGVAVFQVHQGVRMVARRYQWKRIQNISFANRKLIIEPFGEKLMTFYTSSYKKSRYLLHLTKAYHRFQLVMRGLLPPEALSPVGMATHDDVPPSPQKGTYAPSPSATPLPKGVCEVKLLKNPVKGLGFRISDHMLSGDGVVRVQEVVKGGPAHIDGKLKKGDVLLSVNGQPLKGMGHKEVAEVLKNASNIVTLTVRGSIAITPSQSPPAVAGPSQPSTPVPTDPPQPVKEDITMETQPIIESVVMPTDVESPVAEVLAVVENSPPPSPPSQYTRLTVHVTRGDNGSFGLTIAGSSRDVDADIVVMKVTGSSEGILKVGDRLISVNGTSTRGLQYQQVLAIIRNSGDDLELCIQRNPTPPVSTRSPSQSSLNVDGLPQGKALFVELEKDQGALGLRIAGGTDRGSGSGSGFIFVRLITPGSAAERCGKLKVGDIILRVNSESLVGVTHRQAAQVLLQSTERVCLITYRPDDPRWVFKPTSEAPPPPPTTPPPPDTPTMADTVTPQDAKPCPYPLEPILEVETLNVDIVPEAMPPATPPPLPTSPLPVLSDDHSPVPIMTLEAFSDAMPPPAPNDKPHPLSVNQLLLPDNPLSTSSEPYLLPEDGEGKRGEDEEDDMRARSEPHLLESVTEQITLHKEKGGFGFTIDRSRSRQKDHGVFVLSVNGDPASGRLQPGDEVIEVNGMSLLNTSYLEAVRILRSVIGTANLLVCKKGFPDVPVCPPQEEVVHQDSIQIVIDDSVPAKSSPVIRPKFHIPRPPTHPPPPDPPSTPPPLLDDPEFKGQDLQQAALPPHTVPLHPHDGKEESLPLTEGAPPPPALPPPPEASPPSPEQALPLSGSTSMWEDGEESVAPPVPVSPPPAMSMETDEYPEEDDLVSLSPSESSNGPHSISAESSQLLDETTEDPPPPPLPDTPPPPLVLPDQLSSSDENLIPENV